MGCMHFCGPWACQTFASTSWCCVIPLYHFALLILPDGMHREHMAKAITPEVSYVVTDSGSRPSACCGCCGMHLALASRTLHHCLNREAVRGSTHWPVQQALP